MGISGQDTAVELASTGRKTSFLPTGTFGTTGVLVDEEADFVVCFCTRSLGVEASSATCLLLENVVSSFVALLVEGVESEISTFVATPLRLSFSLSSRLLGVEMPDGCDCEFVNEP